MTHYTKRTPGCGIICGTRNVTELAAIAGCSGCRRQTCTTSTSSSPTARAAAEFPQDGLDALPGTAAVLELKRAVLVADAVAALPYRARNDIAIHIVVGTEVEVAVDGAR